MKSYVTHLRCAGSNEIRFDFASDRIGTVFARMALGRAVDERIEMMMHKKYELRPDNVGRTGLYINDILVISNLDEMDKRNFNREFGPLDVSFARTPARDVTPDRHEEPVQKLPSRRGRKLLLAQHEGLIRDMIEHDPSITASVIQNRLRAVGIKFSGISAVTNLARFYGLKLAA